ncbi:MAG: hypothetical protein QM761_14700 [Pseudoxanthomonas sp.]
MSGKAQFGNNVPAAANAEPADKMEQIRELMFGGAMRDFDRRMKELGDRLEAETARIVADYEARLAALETRIAPQIEKLVQQLRQESAARKDALDDLDSRFGQALRSQRNEIDAVLQQHEDNAEAAAERAREALALSEQKAQAAQQQLRDALAVARAELGGEKLAREDLADLMAEVSLRLRGAQDVAAPAPAGKGGGKRG